MLVQIIALGAHGTYAACVLKIRSGSVWLCRGQSRGILSEQAVTREESQPALPAIDTIGPTPEGKKISLNVQERHFGVLNELEKAPTHGFWLNIVETLFGKMAHTFLKRIRVESWEELRERILQGIAEINAAPVVHRWRKFEALETA